MKIICNPASYGGKARKDWPKVVKVLKEEKFDFEVAYHGIPQKTHDSTAKLLESTVQLFV